MSQSLTSVAQRAVRNQPNMLWQILPIFVFAVAAIEHDQSAESQYEIIVKHPVHNGHRDMMSHGESHAPEQSNNEQNSIYPSYKYSYHVDDPYTHDQKGKNERRHGEDVTGMYWLIQPNGIKRMVRYHADKLSGFNAHVEYLKPTSNDHNENYGDIDIDNPVDRPVSAQHVVIYYDHNDQQEENM